MSKLALRSGAFLAVALAQGALAQAQPAAPKPDKPQAAETPTPVPKRPQMPGRIIHDDTLITLDFAGGTVGDYAQAIRKAAEPDALNLFVDSQAAEIPVPAIKLTKASIFDSLSLIARNGLDADGRYLNLGVEVLESTANGGSPVYKIKANYLDPPGNPNRPSEALLEVISLNPIIGLPGSVRAGRPPLDAKTVLGAIEAAVAVSDSNSSTPPVLKFHEASGLLFVKGTNAQRNVAIEVARQLRKDVEADKATLDAIAAGRETYKLPVTAAAAPEILAFLRNKYEQQCCIQFWLEGNHLVITGDTQLVREATQAGSIRLTQLMNRSSNEAASKK